MVTHYDVLGVESSATPAQIRRAYYEKARQLHPDRVAALSEADVPAARRAMQDVNEAWRVLREPGSRAAYDRSLRRGAQTVQRARPTPAASREDEWLDRPYPRRPAEPGDLTIALVRAIPWLAIVAVLVIIFVFTAYATTDHDDEPSLIGRCILVDEARPVQVPCTDPNDGRVVGIVRRANLCTNGATPRAVAGGDWFCLRPAESG